MKSHVLPQVGCLGITPSTSFTNIRFQALMSTAMNEESLGTMKNLKKKTKKYCIKENKINTTTTRLIQNQELR